jgi:hypothetical protein
MSIATVGGVERRQTDLLNRVEHEPRQVPGRQTNLQARRQQQRLLAITRKEVLRHPEGVLT